MVLHGSPEHHQIPSPPPPWEALSLVAPHLDPKSLATASCVCKSWLLSLSSDSLWLPLLSAHFPPLSSLPLSTLSSRRLYSLGRAAASRRLCPPPKPRISLHGLAFALDVRFRRRSVASAVVNPVDILGTGNPNSNGVFRFRVEFPKREGEGNNKWSSFSSSAANSDDDADEVRVSWLVATGGWEAVFGMMECEGKGRFVGEREAWFSKELPSPGCCSSAAAASGLVAELRLGLGGGGEGEVVGVEEVWVGVLNVLSWRYVSTEDALRYLQHFLLPSPPPPHSLIPSP